MPNVLISRVQFLQSKFSWVAGDILDIYVDTDAIVIPAHPLSFQSTGVYVEKNGVSYPGPDGYLGAVINVDYVVTNFSQQICSDTSLVVFSAFPLYPFATYYSLENHYSCVVNPPTCDLIVSGLPVVIPTTEATAADGSVTVTGQSSLSIQYRLNSDFVYNDGSGQSDGFFSGLLPGQYRVYLRDSQNCAANILVTVPVNNTYGTRFRFEYDDYSGNVSRVDIAKRGYADAIEEITGLGTVPFTIASTLSGEEDKFYPLGSLAGEVSLDSREDSKFIEIFTNDPNLYRIIFSKNFGNSTPSYDALASSPLSSWQQKAEGGTFLWNIDDTPSHGAVVVGKTYSIYTLLSNVPAGNVTLNYNFNAVGTFGNVFFEFYKNSTLLHSEGVFVNSTAVYSDSVVIPLSDAPTEIRIYLSRGPLVGNCRVDSLNSVQIIVPEQPAGFETLWTGKVLKQQYIENYKAPPYLVTFKANDGLTELKNYYLIQDDRQTYVGKISAIKLIAHCLKYTGISLNIRVGINLYATGMDSGDTGCPLDQSYIDFEAFYIAQRAPTLDFVLRSILDSFGARLVQWENEWCITRVEEMVDAYDFRRFTPDGDYINFGTYSPVLELDYPSNANAQLILLDNNHVQEIRPSYGTLKTIYKLGLKPNIIRNGDFRLKTRPVTINGVGGFAKEINKDGFTLVNVGYPIAEGYEQIDENNVAYTVVSEIITANATDKGGEAYLQSEVLNLTMGTNNSLKLSFRFKISSSYLYLEYLGFPSYYRVRVPYTKLRVLVTFDNGTNTYYLTGDGRWTLTENPLTYFIEKTDEYVDTEILALQPPGGAGGGDFSVRFYLPFPYYTQFNGPTQLKQFPTYDSGVNEVSLPTGYRTEFKEVISVHPSVSFFVVRYYELQETTEPENLSDYSVLEPDDYDAVNNPRKWVRVDFADGGDVAISNPLLTFTTAIDYIKGEFLTDGEAPIDSVVRSTIGEGGNTSVLEKELILGSYSSVVQTDISYAFDLGVFFPAGSGLSITTVNILLAYLLHAGFYRDSDGTGFDTWARDGIAEAEKLHGITLKSLAAQYKRSSRLLRGTFKSRSAFFGFLNVVRNTRDSDRILLPMGLTFYDKQCKYTGELLELKNIYATPGSDGSGEAPYTSGFTTGFGVDFN